MTTSTERPSTPSGWALFAVAFIATPLLSAALAALISTSIANNAVDQTAAQVARLERQAAVANIADVRSGLVDALVVLRPSSSNTPVYKAAVEKLAEANTKLVSSGVDAVPDELPTTVLNDAQAAYREVQSNVRGLCETQLARSSADAELVRACLVVVTQPPVDFSTFATMLKGAKGNSLFPSGASPS